MRIRIFIITTLLLFVLCGSTFSQKSMYCSIDATLPTFDLSQSNTVSQQVNVSLGYSPVEQFSLFANVGAGLLGEKKGLSNLQQIFESGVGVDYDIFSVNDYKFGLRAIGGYAFDFNSDANNHTILKGGVKITTPSNVFFTLGVNNRFLTKNTTELYLAFGIKL